MNAAAHPRLDPRTKQAIKQALEQAMYAGTSRRFEEQLRNIITANTVANKFGHYSFTYKGEYYNAETTVPRYKNQRLMPELHLAMDEYLDAVKQVEYHEKIFTGAFFTKLLNMSTSVLDYYELLPQSMHAPIKMLGIPADLVYPRQLTDEQVQAFQVAHQDWALMLKKRMILDLVL